MTPELKAWEIIDRLEAHEVIPLNEMNDAIRALDRAGCDLGKPPRSLLLCWYPINKERQ